MSRPNAGWCLLAALFVVLISNPLHAADDQVHVVPASELAQWWKLAPGNGPRTPPSVPNEPTPTGCMAVAFEIHSDGSVSNERVWRTTLTNALSDQQLKHYVLRDLHRWHFVPAPANQSESPVYTFNLFVYGAVYSGDDSDDQRTAREGAAKCDIPDFPQQVQAMAQAAAAKGNGGTQ